LRSEAKSRPAGQGEAPATFGFSPEKPAGEFSTGKFLRSAAKSRLKRWRGRLSAKIRVFLQKKHIKP
jgi:hypothetical protein